MGARHGCGGGWGAEGRGCCGVLLRGLRGGVGGGLRMWGRRAARAPDKWWGTRVQCWPGRGLALLAPTARAFLACCQPAHARTVNGPAALPHLAAAEPRSRGGAGRVRATLLQCGRRAPRRAGNRHRHARSAAATTSANSGASVWCEGDAFAEPGSPPAGTQVQIWAGADTGEPACA